MTTTTATPVKEIRYSVETRDFELLLDGQIVGYARTYGAGEEAINEIVYRRLRAEAARVEEEDLCCELCGEPVAADAAVEVWSMDHGLCNVCAACAGPGSISDQHAADHEPLNCLGEPMPASPEEALARQLVRELNEYEVLGLPCDARYDAKSAQVRSLGYDIGPDGRGGYELLHPLEAGAEAHHERTAGRAA